MYRRLLFVLMIMGCLCGKALTVVCQPGKLGESVSSAGVTELVITGSMDARDFRYIADNLRQLEKLDLTQAAIVAYNNGGSPLFGTVSHFRANEIPTMSLATMPRLAVVSLPLGLVSVGDGAFAGCTSLVDVVMPSGMTYMGAYAFAGCTSLVSVKVPRDLETIGEGAFARCTALKRVALDLYNISAAPAAVPIDYSPGSLTAIGDYAFMGCSSLTDLYVSNRLVTIGKAAFAGSGLQSLDLSRMAGLTAVGNWAYAETPITTAVLPQAVSLGWGVFAHAARLAHVSPVPGLPPLALAGDEQISTIDLSNIAGDTIGDYALYNLSNVSDIVIPGHIAHLGNYAMAGMTGLERMTSQAEAVPSLGENVWRGVDKSGVTLTVPAMSLSAYRSSEQWRDFSIVSGILLGDVNGDGQIDVGDLNALINYMLGKVLGTFIYEAGDIDMDGIIDVADVNGLINIMLDRVMAAPNFMTANTTDHLSIDNFSVKVGQKHTVEVRLDNSHAYTTLQCVIRLPEGLLPVSGTVKAGSRAGHHQVRWLVEDNEVRVVVYAMNDAVVGGVADAPVLVMELEATNDLDNMAILQIDHVAMVADDGTIYYAAPTEVQVNKTSAVDDIFSATDRVFAASGTLYITAQADGQATLMAMNGTARTLRVAAGKNTYHNIDPGIYVVRINGRSYKVRI